MKGTCEWLYQTPVYLRWREERGLLLVRGNPGSGKSTLLKFAVDNELGSKTTPQQSVLRFFFFSSGTDLQKSMEGFLRSILLQLVEQNSDSKKFFHDLCRRRMATETAERRASGILSWHFAELKSMVEILVNDDNIGDEISIFVDAIDECLDQDRSKLVSFLYRLRGRDGERSNRPRILLTCRLYPDENFMGDFNIRLEEKNEDDIQRYVESELRITGEDESDVIEFKNSLASRTGGLFLWVTLVVNRINIMSSKGLSLSSIGSQIFDCPMELNGLYNALLEGIKDEEMLEAGKLFQWIRFSRRPLRLEELKVAMKFHYDPTPDSIFELEDVERPERLISDQQMKKRILHLGRGLIGITDTPISPGRAVVGFHHETVKDFIDTVGLKYLDFRLSKGTSLAKTADLHLANTCTSYLSSEELHAVTARGRRELQSEFLFLNYATTHWLDHAVQAELQELGTFVEWLSPKTLATWVKLSQIFRNWDQDGQPEGTTLFHLAADHGLLGLAGRIIASTHATPTLHRAVRSPVAEIMALGIEQLWSLILFVVFSASHLTSSFTVRSSGNVTTEGNLDTTIPAQSGSWPRINSSWKGTQAQREIVDARDSRSRSALHRAAANGRFEMVRFLHSLGAALSVADGEKETPMFSASENGHLEVVKFLYTQGASADIHTPNRKRWTPIYVASASGHVEVIQFLHAHGADMHTTGPNRSTLLAAAIWQGRFEAVKFLYDHGANVDIHTIGIDGWLPMTAASRRGNLEIVKFLYDHGADIDIHTPDKYKRTPLHNTVACGHLDVVKFLCTHGADIDIHTPDKLKRTPFYSAAAFGHLDVVKFLYAHGANVDIHTLDSNKWTPLTAASYGGHLEIVKFLYDHGADVDIHTLDENHQTPIYNAVLSGHLDVVKFLYDHGADIDIRTPNRSQRTPISAACWAGHLEIVKFLFAHGADIYATDDFGQTPIYLASECDHLEVVKFLHTQGANIHTPDENQRTPIFAASIGGYVRIVEFLCAHGADVNTPSDKGWTPIFAASRKGRLDTVKFLYAHGANIHTPSDEEWTPIFAASNRGHLEVVKFLYNHGADADIHTLDDEHWTPLYAASGKGSLEIVKFLYTHGADTDTEIPDDVGRTPLFTASDTGRLGVVKFLCDNGANIHARDQFHRTPIHAAAERGHFEVVKLLYDLGADADIHTEASNGTTPISIASRKGNVEIVDFLQSRTGNPGS